MLSRKIISQELYFMNDIDLFDYTHDDVIKCEIFRVTGTKASDAELWCFLSSMPEQTVEQTIESPVIWDAIALIMASL